MTEDSQQYERVKKHIKGVLPSDAESYFLYDYVENDIHVDILLFVIFKEIIHINNCDVKSILMPITVTEAEDSFYEKNANNIYNLPCLYRGKEDFSGTVTTANIKKLQSYLKKKLKLESMLYITWMFFHLNN